MTDITAQARRVQYSGNGSAGPFAFSFQINAHTDIKVFVDGTEKTAGSHFNVENDSSETGKINTDGTGRVRFTSGNFPTSSQKITLVSNVPLARTSIYTTGGPLTAANLESDHDTHLIHDQQLQSGIDRAITAPESDNPSLSMTLPAAATRANHFLKFDANGNVTTNLNPSDLGIGSSIVFEGSTANDYETTLTVTDPTADRTWTIPDVTDTFVGLTATQTLTNKTLTGATINDTGSTSVTIGTSSTEPSLGVGIGSRVLAQASGNQLGSVAIGYEAMETATDSRYNVSIGYLSLHNSTGDYNIAIGSQAMDNSSAVTGDYNIVIGVNSGTTITSGGGNTLFGYDAEPSSATASGEFKINTKNGSDTVTYLSGTASGATGTVLVNNHLTVGGDLTVNGDTVTVNTATLSVEDPLIILAKANNSSDSVDIGFYGLYDTSGSQDLYAGLFRDANDSGKWKLFKDLQAAPTTTVDTSGTGYTVGTLVANVEGNVTGDVTGNVSGTAGIATSITASANNSTDETVYPTFVDGATGTQGLETDTGLTYNPSTGVLTATQFTGALSGNATSATSATTATNANHISVADNENTDENNLIPFIEDASATGNVGLESDGDFHYNPSTGRLTATQLSGTLQTASQTNITGVGTITTGVWNGTAIADAYISSSATWNAKVDTGGTGLTKVGTTLNVDAAQSGITSVGTLTSLTTSGDITAKTSDGAILKLQTSHDTIEDGDVLGSIEFSAPDEADGADGDARLLAASIVAEADATFSDTVNKTDLVIKLAQSEGALERARFRHEGALELIGYDDDANPDPSILLKRDSASPADQDFIGSIYFYGKNSTNDYFNYAAILSVCEDVTDGSEDGQLIFRVGEGGTQAWSGSSNNLITLTPDKIYFDAANGTNFGLHGIEDVSTLRLTGTNDVTLSSTNHGFQIGATSGSNLAVDTNEIMARNNGATTTLYLNAEGGYVSCGGGLIINGNNALVYEGATADDYETFVYAIDPTSDRYIYFPNASGTVLVQDTSNDVTIEASTSGSGVDPTITFYKNDTTSGADGDGLAAINFKGKNSSGGGHSYSWISSGIVTASSGSEEGRLQLKVAGSNSNYQNEAYSGQNGLEITNDKTQVKGNLLVDGVIDSSERTLLVTTTVSNSSSVDFNSTYITDTYNTYDVVFTNIHSASDNVAMRCRMGDSDSADTSATYSYIGQMRGTKGSDSTETANYADNSETYMAVTPNDSDMYLGTGSSENFNCHLRFFNLRRTNMAKGFEVISGAYRSSDHYWVSWYQGIGFDHNNYADVNFITFFLSSGNITSGTVKLYGLNL